MKCKPSTFRLSEVQIPDEYFLDVDALTPSELLMLYGFQLERKRSNLREGYFIGSYIQKPLKVSEVENILDWLGIKNIAVSIPSLKFSDVFPCDIKDETVFELWMPEVSERVLEQQIIKRVYLVVPDEHYVTSFNEMIDVISQHINFSKVKVFILSKFAEPGYLGRFIDLFSRTDAEIYLAVEDTHIPKYLKEMASKTHNIKITTSRSHRKLILILMNEDDEWSVIGYRGSMNLFLPGVDDYMEAVNDDRDLQILLHGIIRGFLII